QRAFDAWWRPYVDEHGEPRILLAMRWRLGGQIRVELPGVTDQTSLTDQGERYGVLDPKPPVKVRLHGGTQLAVLYTDKAHEPLEKGNDEPEDSPPGDTVTPADHAPEEKTHAESAVG